MAILNLLDLQPTTISRDLRDKYILLYGKPKSGKTSFAAQCPNNLILCFEKGVNFLPGVYAVDIAKWSDFKALLRQLDKQEIKEKYHTITIDTISIAWNLCEKYICESNGVKTISDIAWGKGYALLKDEFANALRQISMMGYGMILITHAKTRLEKIDDDNTIEVMSPNIPDRAQDVVNALVDIIGYIDIKFKDGGVEGEAVRTLITRESPTVVAGSRLKYLPARIPFGYTELTNAIGTAIERQHIDDNADVSDKSSMQTMNIRPYEETVKEARELWGKLVDDGEMPEQIANAEKIMTAVENIFGQAKKLSEITEEEQALFELLLEEMRTM